MFAFPPAEFSSTARESVPAFLADFDFRAGHDIHPREGNEQFSSRDGLNDCLRVLSLPFQMHGYGPVRTGATSCMVSL